MPKVEDKFKVNIDSPEKSQDQINQEANELFESLIYVGINVPGDHGIPHKDIINYNDNEIDESEKSIQQIIKEGKEFFHRHYYSCAWAIIFTELVQFPIQRITGFVLRNEEYNGPQFAYLRGVVTFMHILKWFEGDITNKVADSSQDVYKVRKLHQNALQRLKDLPSPPANIPKNDRLHILEAMRADMADIKTPEYLPSIMTSSPSVPMSQFDMVMVLGVFYFLLDVNPKICGLDPKAKGYESYIKYLSIIGRYLGIEDRFNPTLQDPQVRRVISKRFMEDIITPCFKNFNEKEFLNLSYFSEHGFYINPFAIAMHILIKDVLGVVSQEQNTYRYVNFIYRFIYFFVPLGLFLVKYQPFLFLGNLSMRFWLWFGIVTTRGRRNNNNSNNSHCGAAGKSSKCTV